MILTKWYEKRKKEKQRKLKIETAKKILIGTAAGSVSGLLGGILFSPKSGKETREDIANSSKEITNNIKEKTIELKETIDNKVSDWKGTDYEKYLRPETLFGNKFEAYVNQKVKGASKNAKNESSREFAEKNQFPF
jgi:uncharacterized phage protein (TIGR02220 family)